MLATIPVASRTATLPIAAREKRGTTTASTATRFPARVAAARTSRPSEPADPDRRGGQMRPVEREHGADGARRRRVARRGPGGRAPPRRSRPRRSPPAAPRPSAACGPGGRARAPPPAATASSAEHDPEVAERATEAGVAHERHDLADVAPRSQRELRGREQQVDGRGDERDAEGDGRRRRHALQGALVAARHLQRPCDHAAEREQADGAQHRQQQHPAACRRGSSSRRSPRVTG